MNSEVITVIIKAIIMVLSVVVTSVVVPYIKERIGEKKFQELQEYIEYAVRCAEQLYTKEQWAEKKKYVMSYVVSKAKELGLELTEHDIDIMVEGIVNLVKHDYSKEQ